VRRGPRGLLVGGLVAVLVLVVAGVTYAVTRGGADPDPGPVASSSTTGSAPASPSAGADALAVATASLADALAARAPMPAARARCTAERWIAEAGLEEMAEAGFFDEDWAYVDQDRSAMTPAIEAAATSAALACATA
jgi:hypothetical protein